MIYCEETPKLHVNNGAKCSVSVADPLAHWGGRERGRGEGEMESGVGKGGGKGGTRHSTTHLVEL